MSETKKERIFIVKVNRNRTPKEAVKAISRFERVYCSVVDSMPKGEGDEVELVFFEPITEEYTRLSFISDDDLEKAYKIRGLESDPIALAAFNEANPAFSDEMPNATSWKDTNGNWCCIVFCSYNKRRDVSVRLCDKDWIVRYLFAGVRKVLR